MHYRTFIAVKATDKDNARLQVESLIEGEGNSLCDWYAIDDGRWVDSWGTVSQRGEDTYKKIIKEASRLRSQHSKDMEFLESFIYDDFPNKELMTPRENPEDYTLNTSEVLLKTWEQKDTDSFLFWANIVKNRFYGWFCTDIQYYNMETGDTRLPNENDLEKGQDWFVVNVDLHN